MKRSEATRFISSELKTIYDDSECRNIAELVMEQVTGLNKEERIADTERELTPNEHQVLKGIVNELKQGRPIQYIMEKAWFYGMELYVDHRVLIPRPETEELADWVIRDVRSSGKNVFASGAAPDQTTQLKILDVGTGSGCIALALKKNIPKAEVWGCDISEEALNVARLNGSRLDIRVDFQGLDFLDNTQQKQLPTVDIIISNPPYIPKNQKESLHRNVAGYEPHQALFVPDNDPLIFYKALIGFSEHRLYNSGSMYMEIHEDLGDDLLKLFREKGFRSTELRKDMQGKNRMLKVGREAVG